MAKEKNDGLTLKMELGERLYGWGKIWNKTLGNGCGTGVLRIIYYVERGK